MWTRRELKAKAKETLHLNYWKTVLVALVFTIVCSGAGVVGTAGGNRASDYAYQPEMTTYEHELSPTEVDQMLEDLDEIDMTDPDNPPIDEITGLVNDYSEPESIVEEISPVHLSPSPAEVFAVAGIVFVIAVVVLAIALTIEAFLANPLEVGTYRFFTRNLNQKAEVKEVAFGFDNAFWAIMDSNITTFIAAFFMSQLGTGSIQGFAVSLAIGVVSTVFTALVVSRLMFDFGTQALHRENISISWRLK